MSGPIREALADLAGRFPILPSKLADALDVYGGDVIATAWIVEGRLLRFEIENAA